MAGIPDTPTTAPSDAAEPQEERQKDRKDHKRGALVPAPVRWIGGVFALLVVALIIFLMLFNWDWFRPPLARLLSARLHRPVRIVGHLKVHLFSWNPTATVQGLQIGEPAWAPKRDFADIGAVTIRLKLLSIFTGDIVLPLVQVDQPDVALFQDKTGKANWDFSDGKKPGRPAKLPAIRNFVINNGKLDITSLQRKLKFTGTVNAREAQTGGGREGFHLGGMGTLNGKPFLMNVTGGPLLNVKPNVPYPFDADVRAGDTHVTAKGQVPHPFNLGQISARIGLSGHDLASLYYLTGITLPNTPPYSIAGLLQRNDKIYTFDNFAGRIGGSDIGGNIKVDMAKDNGRPDVSAALRSRVLDFKDLGSLFGATKKNMPVGAQLATAPLKTSRLILPDAPLDAQRVRGMDADVTYSAATVKAPNLPLRSVKLGVQMEYGLINLNPIEFDFPQGRLSGSAAIDARGPVQKNSIDMRVSNIKMQEFLSKGKTGGPPPVEGVLDARAKLSGLGNSVHKAAASSDGQLVAVIPGGVLRQAFAELLGIDATKGLFMLLSKDKHETDIRCAVADFRVHNGMMQAQRIVLDTGVVVLNGSGQINLNDETLNLSLKGEPKQFRLIHINAPITIGGHLSNPSFGVRPGGAIVQVGVAAALMAVINPALLILPFIDPGLAKNTNCAGLMTVAKAGGAPVTKHQVASHGR